MKEGYTTHEYRESLEGEGDLAYQWTDKPHRHVFDLCDEIEDLTTRLEAAEKERDQQAAQIEELKADAERYRWLRNPDQDVALVLDKVVGESPADEFGGGGYRRYEYRAGEELDAAIDAAREGKS